jgi:GT2 family glycosyltransferase
MQEIMKETFSTGTYMAVRTSVFRDLGGFDETLNHSEDYFFSRKIPKERFRILNCKIGQDDRRFKKMGYYGMLKMIINNFINKNNVEYFKKDIGYWN